MRRLAAIALVLAVAAAGTVSLGAEAKGPQPGIRYFDDPTYGHENAFMFLGAKWRSTSLTYGFTNRTPDLSVEQVDAAIAAAFAAYSNVTNLTFTHVADCGTPVGDPGCQTPQLRILFADGAHGDDEPFDGPNGVLAHAASPGSGEGGDTHFDEAESWTVQDLTVVAMHEFGHALGLDHTQASNCPGPDGRLALMCPIYKDQTGLEPDDIAGIQALYGVNTPPTDGVTVSVAGRGSVTSVPAGISCPGVCSSVFAAGQSVTLRADRSGRRWVFKGWGGACSAAGRTDTCTITADGAQSVTATFKKRRR
jgi:uncharacterized repeat protein (TIGR02543 family)